MDKHKMLALWAGAAMLVAIVIIGFSVCASTRISPTMRYGYDMKKRLYSNKMMLDSQMRESMGGMMMGLAGKTGAEFDQAFLKEMIVHHQGAVAMAKEVLIKSERPELKKMAEDIIKTQTAEIEQMKQWQTAWAQ